MENLTGVLLHTDEGILLIASTKDEKGNRWSAEKCYKYCNSGDKNKDFLASMKIKSCSLLVDSKEVDDKWTEKYWFNSRENFIDVNITPKGTDIPVKSITFDVTPDCPNCNTKEYWKPLDETHLECSKCGCKMGFSALLGK